VTIPVYVDFDGVLNSFSRDVQRLEARTGFGEWFEVSSRHTDDAGEPYPLMLSSDRNAAVGRWTALGASMHWLTTWWEAPADVVEHTGIDAPFVAPPDGPEATGAWKSRCIEARHQADDRFVWIDDDAVPKGFGRAFPNSLILRPSDRFGLFARDVEQVVRYLRR